MSEGTRNRRTAGLLSLLAIGMFGFGFAMVPLYGLLCQVVGIQSANPAFAMTGGSGAGGRLVTVKFDATVNDSLPWAFVPTTGSVRVRVGEMQQVTYRAENRSPRPITGQAIPAVVPWQATRFFSKTECFCFKRQTLAPGEVRDMPLAFRVSPDLPENIDSLTLSYTFMKVSETDEPPTGALAVTGHEKS